MFTLNTSLIFNQNEIEALKEYNRCCVAVRTPFSHGQIGLLKVRFAALNIFVKNGGPKTRSLLVALLKMRPHWQFPLTHPVITIKRYFCKCAGLEEMFGPENDPEMFVTMSSRRFLRELKGEKKENLSTCQ